MTAIDHLIWGCPDLDRGMETIAALTGVAPKRGGVHPGLGTRNALLSLEPGSYLEIIAPDPAQPDVIGAPVDWMRRLAKPGLVSWAAPARDLGALASRLAVHGLSTKGVIAMSRKTTEGMVVRWEVLRVAGHAFGPVVPFFIDWLDTLFPGKTMPPGLSLRRFEIRHPQADELRRLFDGLGIEAELATAALPGLVAELASPKGNITLDPAEPPPLTWRD